MYQTDVVELYKVIEQGGLEQVKELIASNRVDIINALNGHETNIVNHLLNERIVKDKDAKLRILISAGILPKIDQNNNFLMQLVLVIKDIAIRNEILTAVARTYPIFKEYYPESHVLAIHGVKPEKDQALATDGYGLYPIHYAVAAGAANESWFEPKLYDITKTINGGLYQGTSIVWWLISSKRFDEFNRLTQELSPEQRYEILKVAPQNPQHLDQGSSVVLELIYNKRFDDFARLTHGLTPVQSYEILKGAPQNPQKHAQGVSVAWGLIGYRRFDDFARLTHGLTPAQSYEILKAAPQNPQNPGQGYSVAWYLLFFKRFDDFDLLTQGLSPEQRYEILKAAPLQNPKFFDKELPVVWQLLAHKRFDDFDALTHGLTPAQSYEILKAAAQNPNSDVYGISIAWQLLAHKRFDDFIRLTRDLTPEQCFEILKSVPLNNRHDSYMQTVFVLLLNNRSYSLLLNFTKEWKIEQLKQLLSHPLYKKAPNSNNVEQYSTVIKVMVESHSDFAYKLFNPYTYEDLIPWYNSIESNAIESQFIAYLCFSKLHEILHVRFTNPPEALTEEYKEDISKRLNKLFGYNQKILRQPLYSKEAAEKLGMLLEQSAQTIFRKIVIKYLEESGNQDYIHISHLAGNHALEGYAHTLRIIGHTNTANARALGKIHAQAKEKASKLAEENKKLKEEVAALKQPLESSRDETNNSQRNEKRPSFFSAAESYPVKKSKSEQAEQPHDLKDGIQLR